MYFRSIPASELNAFRLGVPTPILLGWVTYRRDTMCYSVRESAILVLMGLIFMGFNYGYFGAMEHLPVGE